MPERPNILVVSDATGATAESVLTSVLVQFGSSHFRIERHPFIRTAAELEHLFTTERSGRCIVVHTLVSARLREILREQGKALGWTVIDLMGPLMEALSGVLHSPPEMKPGIYHHEDQEDARHLREAITFTLAHDDGQGFETLDQANLLILGVSRTGKTPTAIYLSCRRLKVANYPVVMGIEPPAELFTAGVKTVAFRMDPQRLVELRSVRMKKMAKANLRDYASLRHVQEELMYCDEVCRKLPGCRTIDVTNRSVEETSEWITRNVL